jgi:hypothetical protein
MSTFRTVLALLALAALLAAIRFLTDERTFFVSLLVVAACALTFSVGLADRHAVWFGQTKNVPVWGLFVALLVAIVAMGPLLINAVKAAVEEFSAVMQGTQCILGGGGLLIAFLFYLIYRARRNRGA